MAEAELCSVPRHRDDDDQLVRKEDSSNVVVTDKEVSGKLGETRISGDSRSIYSMEHFLGETIKSITFPAFQMI